MLDLAESPYYGLDGVASAAALDEPVPGGLRHITYIYGSALLFIFFHKSSPGFLALYYVPSADHAHTTVAYITKSVTAGSFLRSLHAYGAGAMVVVLLLQLLHKYPTGRTRDGEMPALPCWVRSFALVLETANAGYLHTCDPRAYFATAVGVDAASKCPWISSG